MKNLLLSALVVTVAVMFSACRGSNSTYTTTPTSAYTEPSTGGMQSETPTINNGNGPITTAATEPSMGEGTENSGSGSNNDNGSAAGNSSSGNSGSGTSGNGTTGSTGSRSSAVAGNGSGSK